MTVENFKAICEYMKEHDQKEYIESTLKNLTAAGDEARLAVFNEVFGKEKSKKSK